MRIWSSSWPSSSSSPWLPRRRQPGEKGAACEREGRQHGDRKAKSFRALSYLLFYIRLSSLEILPMYGKPARKGALPQLATPLFCFESAQQLKRPRRGWRGSLPHLATLSILTRVMLDSSGGRAKGDKVVRLAASTPGRPLGIHPQDAAWVYAPASLPDKRRVDIQRKIEQENNMHNIKSTAEVILHHFLPQF